MNTPTNVVGNMVVSMVLLLVCSVTIEAQTIDDTKGLLTKLFTTDGYNKKVRPIANQSHVLEVYCDFVLTSIIDFNEKDESLKTSGYLYLFWFDENLVWNASDHGGIEYIFLPQDDVWRPDVSLRNNFKTNTGLGSSYLNLKIFNEGEVTWEPFQIMESTCDMDITYFPFDSQVCELKFIAWSYSKDEVAINVGKNGIYLEEFSPNSLWDLVNTTSEEVDTYEAAVVFKMTLKRKSSYFLINIIVPVIMLSFLNVMTFTLPVRSGERASYAITVFLSMVVFLTIVATELPKNSDNVSLMSIYLVLMSCLSTVIVFITLLELRIAGRKTEDRPIGMGYRILYIITMRLQCRRVSRGLKQQSIGSSSRNESTRYPYIVSGARHHSYLDNINGINQQPYEEYKPRRHVYKDELTWHKVINALDFLLFWTFLIVTMAITAVLAVICINNS